VQFSRNSGLDGVATSNRFIVVYPEGIGRLPDGSGGAQTWNGGKCCGPAARQGVDDVAFVRRIVSDVARDYRIDRNRVYAMGHSNGGIMALRLACEASDVFAAVGVQAASLEMERCAPARPVAVMQIHGTADTNVPITGGMGTGISGVHFNPPRKAARTFAALDGCRKRPVSRTDAANADLALQRWTSCRQGSSVAFLTVQSAGHAWMGHAAASPYADQFVGPPYMGLDSTRALWSFLAAHPRR
jgi:polyhydroxybutyrate depolymerase